MTNPTTSAAPLGAAAPQGARDSGRGSGLTTTRFVVAALGTALVNLALHAAAFALFLKDFYRAHPPGAEAFVRQLHRGPDQLVAWAMVVTSLTMGLFIATVMRWSRAETVVAGLKLGAIVGVLFWSAVNSGLYASSHLFSLPSALVDTVCSALCMTLAAAFSVWAMRMAARGGRRTGTSPTAELRRPDGVPAS
jgi:hypothetical protein